MNNNTKKIHRIIYIILGCLGITSVVIAAIWGVAVYAQNLENGIKENCEKNAEQDTFITDIKSDVAYLVRQQQIKEIIDSLKNPELMAEAKRIMESNNVGTDTFSTDSSEN